MGMDVYGRKPKSKAGEYFRANVWAWRPIHALICALCSDLLSEKMLAAISFNDGAGPRSQKVCTAMANRFERWLEHHASGHGLQIPGIRVAEDGHLVTPKSPNYSPDLPSPYQISDDDLKEWVEFLRNCGGFRVW